MTTRKIAAIFARVSTAAQEVSLDDQISDVTPWLEEQGYMVPSERILTTIWTSLELTTCPAAKTLLKWVQNREIDAIGVYHGDRLGGEPGHLGYLVSECARMGIQILPKNSTLYPGPEGRFMQQAMTFVKQMSVLRTQMGSRDGLRKRATNRGLPPSMRKVFGYEWVRAEPPQLPRLVPDSHCQDAKRIWEMALDGLSLYKICFALQDSGTPSPGGGMIWRPATIRHILHNPVYAGRVAALKREAVAPQRRRKDANNEHVSYGKSTSRERPMSEWVWLAITVEQPVVSWEQYLSVQTRLLKNRQYAKRNAHWEYLLSGMIVCQTCGSKYAGIRRGSRAPRYYVCCKKTYPYWHACDARNINSDKVEREVKARIRHFLNQPELYLGEARKRANMATRTIDNLEEMVQGYRVKYQQTLERERRAFDQLSPEAFRQEQASLKASRTWLSNQIERTEQEIQVMRERRVTEDMITNMRQYMQQYLDRDDYKSWRKILEFLDLKVYVANDGTWEAKVGVGPMASMTEDSRVQIANNIRQASIPQRGGRPACLSGT